jgi:hypothetical protein
MFDKQGQYDVIMKKYLRFKGYLIEDETSPKSFSL